METPAESQPTRFAAFLAGLQSGMLGALVYLAWMGVNAKLQLRSFWAAENLLATVFHGGGAIHSGLTGSTVSGLALYLLLYSLLGACFAMALQTRLPRFRLTLVSIAFALSWYYLSFHVLWRWVAPLVATLHFQNPTLLGHVFYGAILGQYPAYLARLPKSSPPD